MKWNRALLALMLAQTPIAAATIISQWNFNSQPPDGSTTTGTLSPDVGAGTFSVIGGLTQSFGPAHLTSGGTSSDPAATDNSALVLVGFPNQSSNNKKAGIQFAVDTAGYDNITLSFDSDSASMASRYLRLEISTDGGSTFSDSAQFSTTTANTWFTRTVNLSSFAGVSNDPLVVFRLVTQFQPSTGSYQGVSGTYNGSGSIKLDMVTITGDVDVIVPESQSGVLASAGLVLLAMSRLKRP
jgi:hypothetical protein